jgi:hypothetical protein
LNTIAVQHGGVAKGIVKDVIWTVFWAALESAEDCDGSVVAKPKKL